MAPGYQLDERYYGAQPRTAGAAASPSTQPLSNQASPGAGYGSATQPQNTPRFQTESSDPVEMFRRQNQSGTADEILRRAYKHFTGREADEAGLRSHLSNPQGITGAVRTIYDSPEAQTYGRANPNAWTGQTVDPNPGGGYSDRPPGQPASVQPSIYTGFTPKHAMEGFNFGREQNTGKSAKDAFAFLSNNAPPPPINDKAALGAWFQQHVAPGMNALGHRIISVDGDKFTFENWQGRFTVDYGRGAGAEGGALAWQVDEGSAQMPQNPVYKPQTGPLIQTAVDANGQPVSTTMPISSAIQYRRPYQQFEGEPSPPTTPQPSI